MCEADVYIYDEERGDVLLLEKVDKILPQENELYMENIFGERKTVQARIKEMALVDHRIVLEKL
jgi:predicted RNA-binding protein